MTEFFSGLDGNRRVMAVPVEDVSHIGAYENAALPTLRARFWAVDPLGTFTQGFSPRGIAAAVNELNAAGVPMVRLTADPPGAEWAVNPLRVAHIASLGAAGGTRMRITSPLGAHLANVDTALAPQVVMAALVAGLQAQGIDGGFFDLATPGQAASLIPASAVIAIAGPRSGQESSGSVIYVDKRIGSAYARKVGPVPEMVHALGEAGVSLCELPATGQKLFVVAEAVRIVSVANNGGTSIRLTAPLGPSVNLVVNAPPEQVVRMLDAALNGQPLQRRGMVDSGELG